MVVLSLPYPISNNRYWRKFRNRQIVSKEAVAYKARVAAIAAENGIKPTDKTVSLTVQLIPKANKDGSASKVCLDLDNCLKVCLDALQGAAYENDNQVEEIHAKRLKTPIAGGGLVVKVEELE
jgi:crossover junction endodeoxyribonuclease rusA family protein